MTIKDEITLNELKAKNLKSLIHLREQRLERKGWRPCMITPTYFLYYKKDRLCSISRITGQMCFKQVMKTDTIGLMRGPVEEGIE